MQRAQPQYLGLRNSRSVASRTVSSACGARQLTRVPPIGSPAATPFRLRGQERAGAAGPAVFPDGEQLPAEVPPSHGPWYHVSLRVVGHCSLRLSRQHYGPLGSTGSGSGASLGYVPSCWTSGIFLLYGPTSWALTFPRVVIIYLELSPCPGGPALAGLATASWKDCLRKVGAHAQAHHPSSLDVLAFPEKARPGQAKPGSN